MIQEIEKKNKNIEMPNLSIGSQKLILRQECLNDLKNK